MVPRSRKLRRWARLCLGLAIFFAITAWGYAGQHKPGWAVVSRVVVVVAAAGWLALGSRADAAAENGD